MSRTSLSAAFLPRTGKDICPGRRSRAGADTGRTWFVLILPLMVFLLLSGGRITADAPRTGMDADLPAVSFAFGTVDISDVLSGMLPTYLQAGIDYHGFEFLEGRKTLLRFMAGGARISSMLWTDEDGAPLTEYSDSDYDPLKFALWQGDLQVRLVQELLPSVTAYGEWRIVGSLPVETLDGTVSTILDPGASASAYPDKEGMAANVLKLGLFYDALDKGIVPQGASAELSVLAAPGFLLNELFGKTDFFQLNLTMKGFLPLYSLEMQDAPEKYWMAVYLADRIQVDAITGSAVPQIYQELPSLGRKLRGFESPSLGVGFTAVNNFELRLIGPRLEIGGAGIAYPRTHLFFDAGYAAGKHYNTAFVQEPFLGAAAGIEAAVNLFGFLDIGYRLGSTVVGERIQEGAGFGELFFFLHW